MPRRISLGEGCTPLVEKTLGGSTWFFKLDYLSPTGSFKDKGASVMVSYLSQLGIRAILEDSSGNGGAAVAAYGAAAGMSGGGGDCREEQKKSAGSTIHSIHHACDVPGAMLRATPGPKLHSVSFE